jgi:lipoprotein-anchoring transpeptidase ErfK/SrfK
MPIEDQPGYVPDQSAERLSAAYRRQVVFYRTTEAPGTIIVHTSEDAYPVDSGSSICSRRGACGRPALLRGLSRLMMSQ